MGDICHIGAAHIVVFLQRAGELVKVLRQFAEFILAGGVNASGEVPGGQFVRAVDQSFDRSQQATRQQEGGGRGKQCCQADDYPAGAPLLAVEINIRVARQALDRGGDNPARITPVDVNRPAHAIGRHRATWADQHFVILIDDPELGAPAVRRQVVVFHIAMLE
ncbi:hypothetical protein D3C75_663680 [compost metagenome]